MDKFGIGFHICPDLSTLVQEMNQDNLYYWRDRTDIESDLLPDDAARPTVIEIKAGATINNDYFKGLFYFKNLSKDEKFKALLYYSGSASQERSNGILVKSWSSLADWPSKIDHKRQGAFPQLGYFACAYLISAVISFKENIQNTYCS